MRRLTALRLLALLLLAVLPFQAWAAAVATVAATCGYAGGLGQHAAHRTPPHPGGPAQRQQGAHHHVDAAARPAQHASSHADATPFAAPDDRADGGNCGDSGCCSPAVLANPRPPRLPDDASALIAFIPQHWAALPSGRLERPPRSTPA